MTVTTGEMEPYYIATELIPATQMDTLTNAIDRPQDEDNKHATDGVYNPGTHKVEAGS